LSEEQYLRRFVLNEHLDVVLDNEGRTLILLDGEEYDMCKRLVLNISVDEIPAYNEISSIDDAAQRHATLFKGKGYEPEAQVITISPEEEFFGHCSNLQAWVDHDYDTRLLHSNLSFNLLRGLAEAGDVKATRVLDTEIVERARNASKMTATVILFTFADKQLSPSVYKAFAENSDPQVRFLISKQPNLPVEAIALLAKDDDVLVRRAIAERIDVPDDAAANLLKDVDAIVRHSIVKRSDLVKEIDIAYRGTILATVPASVDRLDLSKNGIESIAEIEGLDKLLKLKSLILSDNKISKIEGIETLVNLQRLSLSNNYITKIEGLECLEKLVEVGLSRNKIARIEGLEHLGNLAELKLFGNQISIIEGLDALHHLVVLILYENQISKIEGLENLWYLRSLVLSDNYIKKIEGLEYLKYLAILELPNNQISKIEGLNSCLYLQKLNLSGNRIMKIEGLDELKYLHSLNLSGNMNGFAPDGWIDWRKKILNF